MPQMTRRIGILGGSFDPIHRGHVDLAEAAQQRLGLTSVFVIPANVPPHRDWRATDLELRSTEPSYTTSTLQRFHERAYQPSELFFLIGGDAFAEIALWKDYPQILDATNFVVVSRPGCRVSEMRDRLPNLASRMVEADSDRVGRREPVIILIDVTTADVSSTAIRKMRSRGESITGMVDPGVEQHIEQHGLYSATIPGRRGSDRASNEAAGRLHG
jgi:nicotinate-nucleotide adenylyltransferase